MWVSNYLVFYFGHYNPTTNNANAQRGVIYESTWVTSQTSVGTLTDWLVVCTSSSNSGYYNSIDGVSSSGGDTCIANPGGQTLSINGNTAGYQSSFGYSQLMIWNTQLTTAQVDAASAMLMSYLSTGVYANFPSATPSNAPTRAPTIPLVPVTAMPSSPTGQPSGAPTHSTYFNSGNCPGGMYSSNDQCVMCPAGTYLSAGQRVCTACPAGTHFVTHQPSHLMTHFVTTHDTLSRQFRDNVMSVYTVHNMQQPSYQ